MATDDERVAQLTDDTAGALTKAYSAMKAAADGTYELDRVLERRLGNIRTLPAEDDRARAAENSRDRAAEAVRDHVPGGAGLGRSAREQEGRAQGFHQPRAECPVERPADCGRHP